MLAYYNLELYPNNLHVGIECADFHPLSAIGIKMTTQDCHEYEENTGFHAITTLSPAALELPSLVELISRQFKALARDYDVEFGDHSVSVSTSHGFRY